MRPEEFRTLFPALRSTVWLDTPGAPPGSQPVVDTLRDALDDWSSGGFGWLEWDGAVAEARTLFARFIGVNPTTVSAVGSLGEAAATVAASIPRGRVVVPAQEFRSNLFPWTAGHEVVAVPPRHGSTRLEDLIDALDENTALLAVSEVTSREGQRLDLSALRTATDRVGARLFVNLTQSLGALSFDLAAVRPDYLAVHGYKWLLCPRGAAWLVTRPDLVGELRPLAPGWKSTGPPYGYFAGPMRLATDASRCDASPAWLSWMGACAALRLMLSLDARIVERHCLALATRLIERAREIGLRPLNDGGLSQIVVLRVEEADTIAARLRHGGIRATALGDRVRFGFHYFNNREDVDAVVRVLSK
ncbi:aminotransferase class V-fold PLP-dependent enzyme [Nonomuraea muscovyensis]|uniref:aminotransferase class V-fold PLP-dependent enzyme n=1 Tax=Nonomuraea muscovyensis TaxID=1124761 RepID=UPI001617FE42|nr:aminotransferase class V-fold PLP-dependent enzyme [Nonomuraea muscovyensis]